MGQSHVLDDPSVKFVRVDVIEAWARHAYAVQNFPGYTSSVRRAILGQCTDGRAAYVEYWRVGWRLWRTTEWLGPAEELGPPRPAPVGFQRIRRLRLYQVRERSMVLSIGGVDRIISFTGEEVPKGGHRLRKAAWAATLVIPNVGTLADWTNTATHRLRPGSTGPRAVAAADHWRGVLSRTQPGRQPNGQHVEIPTPIVKP